MKAPKQKRQAGDQSLVVKAKARRAGDKAKSRRARPLVRQGRELNDVGDERSWMDWVTPEQIKVAARSPRADS